jgi:hypothetical protein
MNELPRFSQRKVCWYCGSPEIGEVKKGDSLTGSVWVCGVCGKQYPLTKTQTYSADTDPCRQQRENLYAVLQSRGQDLDNILFVPCEDLLQVPDQLGIPQEMVQPVSQDTASAKPAQPMPQAASPNVINVNLQTPDPTPPQIVYTSSPGVAKERSVGKQIGCILLAVIGIAVLILVVLVLLGPGISG